MIDGVIAVLGEKDVDSNAFSSAILCLLFCEDEKFSISFLLCSSCRTSLSEALPTTTNNSDKVLRMSDRNRLLQLEKNPDLIISLNLP